MIRINGTSTSIPAKVTLADVSCMEQSCRMLRNSALGRTKGNRLLLESLFSRVLLISLSVLGLYSTLGLAHNVVL